MGVGVEADTAGPRLLWAARGPAHSSGCYFKTRCSVPQGGFPEYLPGIMGLAISVL